MKKIVVTLLIVLCSFATFSSSKTDALAVAETSFVKDGLHVQVFYDDYTRAVLGIVVTLGGPGTPDYYAWTPIPGSISLDGCFTGVIYVEDLPGGQAILDVACNN